MITLLLCSVTCLFVALIASLVQRIVPNLKPPTADFDPLDPLSYSRGPM